jgi:hypothetical protein
MAAKAQHAINSQARAKQIMKSTHEERTKKAGAGEEPLDLSLKAEDDSPAASVRKSAFGKVFASIDLLHIASIAVPPASASPRYDAHTLLALMKRESEFVHDTLQKALNTTPPPPPAVRSGHNGEQASTSTLSHTPVASPAPLTIFPTQKLLMRHALAPNPFDELMKRALARQV